MNDVIGRYGLTADELQQIHAGREVMYNLFYRAFIVTPDQDLYEMLDSLLIYMGAVAESSSLAIIKEGIKGLTDFKKYRSTLSTSEQAEFDLDTQRQYTKMFCLTNSVRMAESHYKGSDRLSRQEPYDRCIEIYAQNGFPKNINYPEDADFLPEQMRFMSFLASKSVEALEKDDTFTFNKLIQTQIDFQNDHFTDWLDSFRMELVSYKDASRLYLPLALFMAGFIQDDVVFLKTHK